MRRAPRICGPKFGAPPNDWVDEAAVEWLRSLGASQNSSSAFKSSDSNDLSKMATDLIRKKQVLERFMMLIGRARRVDFLDTQRLANRFAVALQEQRS